MSQRESTLKEGTTNTASFSVTPADLASSLKYDPSDVYAEVLATPKMIAWMELVAARMLVPICSSTQLSVGARIDVEHLAATPPGVEVSVTATFTGMGRKGKLFVFEVEASDPGGVIGRARHERAIIETSRLYKGAKARTKVCLSLDEKRVVRSEHAKSRNQL